MYVRYQCRASRWYDNNNGTPIWMRIICARAQTLPIKQWIGKKKLCWLFKEKKSGEKRASIAASEKKLGANACWSQESERDARSICSSYCRIFLSRPNWTVWCVCVWMCWLGSAPLRTSHSKSYGWWFSYSFFQTHTWFNSNSIFFLLLAFCPVSSSYHSVLSLLWRGNFFFIHFFISWRGNSPFFVLHLFVCKEVFSLFFYRERTCDACICITISVKYFFMIVKRFYSLPLNRKRGKSIFFHLVILHVVVRELFFHNKIFYL